VLHQQRIKTGSWAKLCPFHVVFIQQSLPVNWSLPPTSWSSIISFLGQTVGVVSSIGLPIASWNLIRKTETAYMVMI